MDVDYMRELSTAEDGEDAETKLSTTEERRTGGEIRRGRRAEPARM